MKVKITEEDSLTMFPHIDPKFASEQKELRRIISQFMQKIKRYRKEGKKLTEADWEKCDNDIYDAVSKE